jgi:hypothetical protein
MAIRCAALLMLISIFAAVNLRASASLSKMVQLKAEPEIGKHISPPYRKSGMLCMTNSAQLDDCFEALINGIQYVVSYRKSKNDAVTRIYTNDAKFSTPRGLHVGDMLTIRKRSDLLIAPYFEVYAATDEAWIPVVGFLDRIDWGDDDKSGELTGERVDDVHPSPENPIQVRISGFVKTEPGRQVPLR